MFGTSSARSRDVSRRRDTHALVTGWVARILPEGCPKMSLVGRPRRRPATPTWGAGLSWFSPAGRGNHDHDRVNQPCVGPAGARFTLSDDQLAGAAFLARDNRRPLWAYGHDLPGLFQWAAEPSLAVLAATRTHPELYRTSRRRGSEGYRSRERVNGSWTAPPARRASRSRTTRCAMATRRLSWSQPIGSVPLGRAKGGRDRVGGTDSGGSSRTPRRVGGVIDMPGEHRHNLR